MADRRKRYEQSLRSLQEETITLSSRQLMIAICLTQLDRFAQARRCYRKALRGLLRDRLWLDTNQPNWLVDVCVLANQSRLHTPVFAAVENYALVPHNQALMTRYAYATAFLLTRRDEDASKQVPGLLARPKVKDTCAMGKTIQAIVDGDQVSFDTALDELLLAHRGRAKFGGLRETPEGYLCLPAMSLSKVAWQRGLKVNAESEYLSKGYLEYLMHTRRAGSCFRCTRWSS